MKSIAAVVREFDRPMEIVEIDIGDPKRGEVRVRIIASGICGSDVKVLEGKNPLYPAPPIVLGHESVGVVDAIGADVDSVVEGDRVLVSMNRFCGRCAECSAGAAYLCTDRARQNAIRGLMADGTYRFSAGSAHIAPFIGIGSFSEYIVVGESMLIPLGPGEFSDAMALLSCGVVTGFGAVRNIAEVKAGETVLVAGCGGVGLNVVQAAILAGASAVLAVDTNPSKLNLARALGATATIVAADDLAEQVRRFEPAGVDHAFDVTGVASVLPKVMTTTRPGGTTVMVGSPSSAVELPPTLFMSGRRLLGCVGGNASPASDLPLLVRLVRAGRLVLEPLITERVAIVDINAAMARVRSGDSARSLVVFGN